MTTAALTGIQLRTMIVEVHHTTRQLEDHIVIILALRDQIAIVLIEDMMLIFMRIVIALAPTILIGIDHITLLLTQILDTRLPHTPVMAVALMVTVAAAGPGGMHRMAEGTGGLGAGRAQGKGDTGIYTIPRVTTEKEEIIHTLQGQLIGHMLIAHLLRMVDTKTAEGLEMCHIGLHMLRIRV